MKIRFKIIFLLSLIPILSSCNEQSEDARDLELRENWTVCSSATANASGQQISTKGFDTDKWYKTSVPSTVMNTLLKNGLFKDAFVGNNLEKIDRRQFDVPWWYRTEFKLNAVKPNTELIFEGINYRANIWINGKKAFSSDSIFGSFRMFKLKVADYLVKGKNAIAIEVIKPKTGEPTIGFVDWNPEAPDNNLGIWRPVRIRQTESVSIENPFVQSVFAQGNYKEADLIITANLCNHSNQAIKTNVSIQIESISIHKEIELKPHENKKMEFKSDEFTQLHLKNPELWWPVNMGKARLYQMQIAASIEDKKSDIQSIRFGIREVKDYMTAEGYRGYRINGVNTLIKGGGWVDDLFLGDSDKKIEDQLKYVKHMNLNTIRLEGFWGSSQKLYDMADEYGILVMAGWSCQWEWKEYMGIPDDEYGCIKSPADMQLVANSLKDQVLWLRNHASLFVWVLGSDKLPRPELEHKYVDIFKNYDPSRPSLISCKEMKSEISGASGVKMAGPYDYVGPNYWYTDTKNGGAFGFNTETGPGPQPTPIESLKKMIPASHLWPIDTLWNYHCGRHSFGTMNTYLKAFNERYGETKTAEEFSYKSQIANYEAMRAMFEAFEANRGKATGVIQWMLNSAWPEFYWQLYDYYLMPNGAFYGAKAACRPLNIIYNYGNDSIYLSNNYLTKFTCLKAKIKVYALDGSLKYEKDVVTEMAANSSKAISHIPKIDGLSKVYFVSLSVNEPGSSASSDNFYWLSQQKDEYDFPKTSWVTTPMSAYSDFKSFNTMPKAKLEQDYDFKQKGETFTVIIKLKNTGKVPALFIEMSIKGKHSKKNLLPIFLDDNYITLMPGESRELKATFGADILGNDRPEVICQGWNLL